LAKRRRRISDNSASRTNQDTTRAHRRGNNALKDASLVSLVPRETLAQHLAHWTESVLESDAA
jgi:hypothetical protein